MSTAKVNTIGHHHTLRYKHVLEMLQVGCVDLKTGHDFAFTWIDLEQEWLCQALAVFSMLFEECHSHTT